MGKTSTFTTQFRRRREGKTNYKKRLGLLKSSLHRLVVRRTNKYVIAQFIEFKPEGDRTKVQVNSKELEKFGWKHGKKNLPAAYLTGLLAGVKAKQKRIDKAVLDIGFAMPMHKGWWASALKGSLDAGVEIKAGKEAKLPEERINGKHIELFAKMPGKKGEQFSKLGKAADLKQLTKAFEETKQKILKTKQNGDLNG